MVRIRARRHHFVSVSKVFVRFNKYTCICSSFKSLSLDDDELSPIIKLRRLDPMKRVDLMSNSNFPGAGGNSLDWFHASHALNNGLVSTDETVEKLLLQLEAVEKAKTFPMGTPPTDPLPYQMVNGQIPQPHSVPPGASAYSIPFGNANDHAPSYACGLVNDQQPDYQWAQPQGPINLSNTISHQKNLHLLMAKPESSQSSNITNADHEKRLRKQESDRRYRTKKEQIQKDTTQKLAEVIKEKDRLEEDNKKFKKGEEEMKNNLDACELKMSFLENQVVDLKKELQSQHKTVEVLSEQLTAGSDTQLLIENERLKRKIELLTAKLNNPDSIKLVELQEEIEKWKREAKRLKVINDALCSKIDDDNQ